MSKEVLYALLATALMGVQPIISSIGYKANMNTLDITFLRYLASGLIMLPYVLSQSHKIFKYDWCQVILLIILSGPLYSLVLIGGLEWSTASHSALIFPALTPVFAVVFAMFFLEKGGSFSLFGLLLLVSGVILIGIENFAVSHFKPDMWIGDLFFVLAAIMWALYIIFLKKWKADALFVAAIVQVAGLLYVPVYLYYNGLEVFNFGVKDIALQLVYQGIVISIITVVLFNLAVKSLGAKTSAFMAVVPLVGVFLSVIFLGEPLSVYLLLGTFLIALGLLLSVSKK